jgi:hypothetical protein
VSTAAGALNDYAGKEISRECDLGWSAWLAVRVERSPREYSVARQRGQPATLIPARHSVGSKLAILAMR